MVSDFRQFLRAWFLLHTVETIKYRYTNTKIFKLKLSLQTQLHFKFFRLYPPGLEVWSQEKQKSDVSHNITKHSRKSQFQKNCSQLTQNCLSQTQETYFKPGHISLHTNHHSEETPPTPTSLSANQNKSTHYQKSTGCFMRCRHYYSRHFKFI